MPGVRIDLDVPATAKSPSGTLASKLGARVHAAARDSGGVLVLSALREGAPTLRLQSNGRDYHFER